MTGEASAPASSANLGPGFDVLGLALELRCRVRVHPAAEWVVDSDQGDPDAGMLEALQSVAAEGEWHVEAHSEIPVERGLGSSAALLAAVAAATRRSRGSDVVAHEIFSLVAEAEGHPDNAAPAVFGGLVAVASGVVHGLDMAPGVVPVVAVPDDRLATGEARKALPDRVAHDVARRSVARGVFLVEALRTGESDLFAAAVGEELHEPHRAHLSPITAELVEAARAAGAVHACWSGAGPSVLALASEASQRSVVDHLSGLLGDRGFVLTPALALQGLLWDAGRGSS